MDHAVYSQTLWIRSIYKKPPLFPNTTQSIYIAINEDLLQNTILFLLIYFLLTKFKFIIVSDLNALNK